MPGTRTAPAVAERIARLFAEGHTASFVLERGLTGGWRRAELEAVLRDRCWVLGRDGRLPRELRPALTPGAPVPRAPAGLAASPLARGWTPTVLPGGSGVSVLPAQREGRRAPAAPLTASNQPAPQAPSVAVSPPARPPTRAELAPVALLRASAAHPDARIRRAAQRAEGALERLRGLHGEWEAGAAARAAQEAHRAAQRARLRELETEADRLRGELGERRTGRPRSGGRANGANGANGADAAGGASPIAHGTWSGYLKETKRGLPHCAPCEAAKEAQCSRARAASPVGRRRPPPGVAG